MANKYRGEVEVEADGKKYTLRIGMAEMAEMEQALKLKGIGELGAIPKQASPSAIMAMTRIALAKRHPNLTPTQFEDIVDSIGLVDLTFAMERCLILAMRGPDEAAEEDTGDTPNA